MIERIDSPYDRIQFDIDPNAVNPAENPIEWVYRAESTGQASRAVMALSFNGASFLSLVDGDSFKLETIVPLGSGLAPLVGPVRFTFSNNATPNQLPIAGIPEVAARAFFLLSNNPQFSRLYSIALRADDSIVITARFPGSKYRLVISDLTFIAPAVLLGYNDLGTDGNALQSLNVRDFAVYMEVFHDDNAVNRDFFLAPAPIPAGDSVWQKIGAFSKPYTGQDEFVFDISEALKPFVSTRAPFYRQTIQPGNPPYPRFELANELIGRYAVLVYINYLEDGESKTEIIDSLGFGSGEDNEANLWYVNSALPRQLNRDEVYTQYYFNYWRRKQKGGGFRTLQPLTYQPEAKRIDRRQAEYLYFLNDRFQGNTLSVVVDYTFEDGQTLLNQQPGIQAPVITPGAGSAYYVEVSPRLMNLDAVESSAGSRVKSYAVRIFEGGGGFNQPYLRDQIYVLDNDYVCKPYDAVLLFLSPLGGFDSVFLKGVGEKGLDVERLRHNTTMQHRTLPRREGDPRPDYEKVSERKTYAAEAQAVYTARTGWMDKAHYEWLRGLAVSTEVYMVSLDDIDQLGTGGAVPRLVNVESFGWTKNSRDEMYAAEIELDLSYDLASIKG